MHFMHSLSIFTFSWIRVHYTIHFFFLCQFLSFLSCMSCNSLKQRQTNYNEIEVQLNPTWMFVHDMIRSSYRYVKFLSVACHTIWTKDQGYFRFLILWYSHWICFELNWYHLEPIESVKIPKEILSHDSY